MHLQSSLWHRNRGNSAQDAERRLDSTTASTSGRTPTMPPTESPVRLHTQWHGMDQGRPAETQFGCKLCLCLHVYAGEPVLRPMLKAVLTSLSIQAFLSESVHIHASPGRCNSSVCLGFCCLSTGTVNSSHLKLPSAVCEYLQGILANLCMHAAARTNWRSFGDENTNAGSDNLPWREVSTIDDSPQRSPVSKSALRSITNQPDVSCASTLLHDNSYALSSLVQTACAHSCYGCKADALCYVTAKACSVGHLTSQQHPPWSALCHQLDSLTVRLYEIEKVIYSLLNHFLLIT